LKADDYDQFALGAQSEFTLKTWKTSSMVIEEGESSNVTA
jgi:hypothetical protein